jgi:hypothetical protein
MPETAPRPWDLIWFLQVETLGPNGTAVQPLVPSMQSFLEACHRLVARAPVGPYPRSRELYFAKHWLEPLDHDEPYRVFIERFHREHQADGRWRLRPVCFAIVHWQGDQLPLTHYGQHLRQHWLIQPVDLHSYHSPWFRDAGAYARFYVPIAVDSRDGVQIIGPEDRPASAEDLPGSEP